MLIVITRDQAVMDWVSSPNSHAAAWAPAKQLSAGDRSEADKQLATLLKLKVAAPLCLTGHGNSTEVGDVGDKRGDWGWKVPELAALLGGLVDGYVGPILMEVCANSKTSFASNLVAELIAIKKLKDVWIYGYKGGVDVTHPFPDPATLDDNRELTGQRVKF
jgi:hypothetical protein